MNEQNNNSYYLPKRLYRECMWIIRDKSRLEDVIREDIELYERESLEAFEYLDSMHRALLEIPTEYRAAVINSITDRYCESSEFVHENTIKKYKHKFIYNLTKNLSIH